MAALPVTSRDDGVAVAVRLTPKASANRIDGLAPGEDGSTTLRARVTAAPENGKANAALIKLLAKAWKLPKTALTVTAGALPMTAFYGGTVNVDYTVTNLGASPSGQTSVTMVLSPDAMPGPNDQTLGSETVMPLQPGA